MIYSDYDNYYYNDYVYYTYTFSYVKLTSEKKKKQDQEIEDWLKKEIKELNKL
jgi:hypothetical protein